MKKITSSLLAIVLSCLGTSSYAISSLEKTVCPAAQDIDIRQDGSVAYLPGGWTTGSDQHSQVIASEATSWPGNVSTINSYMPYRGKLECSYNYAGLGRYQLDIFKTVTNDNLRLWSKDMPAISLMNCWDNNPQHPGQCYWADHYMG